MKISDEDMKECQGMLAELLEKDSGIYAKELEFLESLKDWNSNFSEKQAEWLERIYKRVM